MAAGRVQIDFGHVERKAQPDTFETPDVPDTGAIVNDFRPLNKLGPDSSDFSLSSEAVKSSFSRFYDSELDTSKENYDSISIRTKKGATFKNQSEFEVLGGRSSAKFESPLQRYHRFKNDISAFLSELDQLQAETSPNYEIEQGTKVHEIVEEVQKLQGLLHSRANSVITPTAAKGDEVSARLISELKTFTAPDEKGGEANQDPQNAVTYTLYYKGKKPGDEGALAGLEQRINAIEKLVGSAENPKPLAATLHDLEHRFSALNEARIAKLENRAKAVNQALSEESPVSVEQESKVQAAFELMTRWDETAQDLPGLVGRLLTLRAVHEQTAGLAQQLNLLQSQQPQLSQTLRQSSSQLAQLDQALSSNAATIQSNVQSLEERMKTLEEKLARLNA